MNLINLTAHAVNIHNSNRELVANVPPSGQVARCAVGRQRHSTTSDGVELFIPTLGEVVGLPDPEPATLYIVSLVVKSAAGRNDVASPGELIRNDAGQPIGCIGLDL